MGVFFFQLLLPAERGVDNVERGFINGGHSMVMSVICGVGYFYYLLGAYVHDFSIVGLTYLHLSKRKGNCNCPNIVCKLKCSSTGNSPTML